MEHYRLPNGTIAGEWGWLIEAFKTAETTISMRTLYAGPHIIGEAK